MMRCGDCFGYGYGCVFDICDCECLKLVVCSCDLLTFVGCRVRLLSLA